MSEIAIIELECLFGDLPNAAWYAVRYNAIRLPFCLSCVSGLCSMSRQC